MATTEDQAVILGEATPAETPVPSAALVSRFGPDAGPDLRARTARGTLVNAAFMIGTSALALVQGIVIAGLLPTSLYGEWGLLMAAFMTLIALGSVGIDDKYVQQDTADQQRAFEVAFTLQLALSGVFALVLLAGMPAFALLYGRPEIILPGVTLALVMPALALQMPLWTHYRRMDFVRQRALQLIDPVVTLAATLALVLAGLGLWALVLGAMTGSWAAALVLARTSPYRIRLRWDAVALREYRRFSWPLFVGALSSGLLVQVPVVVSARVLGIEAVAGIALANNLAQFTTRVDDLVTNALYPAICAVKDRTDVLYESFWKSNRLALLWAAPLGLGAALFTGDFVRLVLGEKWRFAVPLITIWGLIAVVNQIGFNWTAFFRAVGDTRPIATFGVVSLVAVLAIAVPCLALWGLTGFAAGMGAATLISLAVRLRYLRRLFPMFRPVAHIARGIGPALPALAVVLAVRLADPGPRTVARVAAEAIVFAALALAGSAWSERRLLAESLDYLRRGRPAATRA